MGVAVAVRPGDLARAGQGGEGDPGHLERRLQLGQVHHRAPAGAAALREQAAAHDAQDDALDALLAAWTADPDATEDEMWEALRVAHVGNGQRLALLDRLDAWGRELQADLAEPLATT